MAVVKKTENAEPAQVTPDFWEDACKHLTRKDRVECGGWAKYGGVPIEVAATFWCAGGAWCFVRSGIRGILAPDEQGRAVCYVICEPSTNYYKNMTGCRWMPVLIDQCY